jgi:ABC-2 type transport system permease protein
MTSSSQVWLLAKREFVERGRAKAFIIAMSLIALAILAVGPVIKAVAPGEPDATVVGLVGIEVPGIDEELSAQGDLFAIAIEVVRYGSVAEAEAALEDGSADVVLAGGDEIVFYDAESTRLIALVQRSVDTVITESMLRDRGLSEDEIAAVRNPVPVTVSVVEEIDPREEIKRGATFVGTLLLYVSIIVFGQFVAMGTVEEKQNRVVEVVLSRVQAWQILVGKVAGIGLLGLLQLAIFLGAAFISAQIAGFADVDVTGIGLPIIGGVFFWFVLGYTFYAFLYAAVGSTVSRQEDLQGAIILPIIVIFPGYLLAIAAVENAETLVVRIGSLLPMWAPFVMPVRIAADAAAPWEVALAVVGSIVGAIGLVWIGSRVYRGALLHVGTRMKLKDAWKVAVGGR